MQGPTVMARGAIVNARGGGRETVVKMHKNLLLVFKNQTKEVQPGSN